MSLSPHLEATSIDVSQVFLDIMTQLGTFQTRFASREVVPSLTLPFLRLGFFSHQTLNC